MHIMDYLDYREFLGDYYRERKKRESWYSLRHMGQKLTLDASFLARIMNKSEHLSWKKIPHVAGYFKFNNKEEEYFTTLVHFNRVKKNEDAAKHFEKLMNLRSMEVKSIEPSQYKYYSKWYFSAIKAVLGFFPLKSNYGELGKLLAPNISATQVKEAVTLLTKLELVRQNEKGYYEPTDHHITASPEIMVQAMRKFQKEMVLLGSESIQRHAPENRDVSSLTVCIDGDTLSDIREIIRECRENIVKRVAKDASTNTAYQINFQVFPLIGGKNEGK